MSEPTLVVKIRSHTADHERASALLLKAHKLASETGLVSFANCLKKDDVHTVFSSSGFGLTQDVDGDWETDTLRTGLLGTVTINMPRLILEAGNDKVRLGEILKERVEMANRAIEVKYASLKNNFENLLPFLSQRRNGDRYFRIEDCSRIVNIAGFKEAVEIFSEKSITDEKSLSFASELAQTMSSSIRKVGRRRGKRLSPALLLNVEAGERLAHADIGRYGIAKVKFSGTRDRPFYSTTIRSSFNATKLGEENLVFYDRSRELVEGGTLTIVELNDPAYEPSDLMTISKQLLENHNVRFLTYERKLTHCAHCNKSWFGLLRKCPTCGAIGTLAFSNRFCGA